MKKFKASERKIDYYQIEPGTVRRVVKRLREQKKELPVMIGLKMY